MRVHDLDSNAANSARKEKSENVDIDALKPATGQNVNGAIKKWDTGKKGAKISQTT